MTAEIADVHLRLDRLYDALETGKLTERVYLCTISNDSHLHKSSMVIESTPAFLNRLAKL